MKILIACGGTGGHIFPGLSLYHALKKRDSDADIVLVLARRAISASIVSQDFPHIYLSIVPLRFIPPHQKFWRGGLQNIIIVLKLLKGIFQSLGILFRFRPAVVVGFGGYASFFLVFFACIFRIKTIIHEQNVTPGRANWILAYFVDKIAISFSKTRDYFGINSSKVKFTGSPLRPDLSRIEKTTACQFFGLYPDKFTILVMGGSQGSQKINNIFLKAVSLIKNRSEFQVIHLCGEEDQIKLSNGYKGLGIRARVFSFFGPMQYVYSAVDIVISRAGSATINEIALFGLPSILIPYPYVRRHQIENANYFCQNNAAILIEEKDLSPEILKGKILKLFNNPDLQESMSKNILMFSRPKEQIKSLADLVLNEAQTYGAKRHKSDG